MTYLNKPYSQPYLSRSANNILLFYLYDKHMFTHLKAPTVWRHRPSIIYWKRNLRSSLYEVWDDKIYPMIFASESVAAEGF